MQAPVQHEWARRDGDRLLRVIENRGMSQRRLAERMGVSKDSVNGWVRGTTRPTVRLLRAAATELDCSIDELLGLPLRFAPSDLRARHIVGRLAALAHPLEVSVPELLDVLRSAREHAERTDRQNADSA